MGKFLTQKVRLEQCHERRYWHTLDNELFQDDDGTIYLVPRNFKTDNYTIPCWIAWLGGSPVDFRVEPSHLHDTVCDSGHAVFTTLTKDELLEKGYYRFSEHRQLWVCENIPQEYLAQKKLSKKQCNDLLWRALCATNTPLINKIIIRVGVFFNFAYVWYEITKKFKPFDLNRFYDKEYWEELVPLK